MAENNNTKTVSRQVMELKDLISAPLIATIEADSQSAGKYFEYLMQVAFDSYDKTTGEVGEIRNLVFIYTSSDIHGSKKQKVTIPILTLLPLPLLQVQEADFDFDIQIIDAVSADYSEQFSLKEGKAIETESTEVNKGIKLRASLASSSGDMSSKGEIRQGLNANMKVHVKMRQADMPGGLSNLLHLTTNNLLVEDIEAEDVSNESNNTIIE